MTVLFKAFSALLSYPSADMRAALPEIAGIVQTSPLVGQRERQNLLALIDELGRGDLLSAEERYVDLFDRGRALSLNLFEHLHGESRDRGTAMVDLKRLYQGAGFDLATRELPDYLPAVLEYLSCREIGEARALLADCAHIMKTIARSLIARESRYAAVLQALIAVAGEKPVEAAGIKPIKEPVESLDRDWAEMPAFASPPAPGRPGAGTTES
jgi:nitrate reductase molybdenum cofactor assembly chaperone NarJ/NarW